MLLVLLLAATKVFAQIPCDDAYGEHCPDKSGWEVGECLKGKTISEACESFIAMQEACRVDIDTHCNGKEFTGDCLSCLNEWTKPELLSPACLAKMPPKVVKKEKKLSKEERKKADARRRIRNKAAKMAREEKVEEEADADEF